ncbi:hypothetical protein SAMN02745885_01888 [Carboxydocella sporoproducens DSM 16521]|uniref:PIN domain-containing protein n=2 Tax=Carboxydocella TaxID=178898 RepID=A0A1T4R1X7_9FIRM|nr:MULTISPECIES: hypothetical protein [Carboxydocella]AVX21771.1 hypothetical protein CFE_2628 [Carboxydocella thermautotrophica]AVX32177.1 hypothetical protein CTH_2640 [Carboxydocella thermautotrophica]SKA09875.1 hypothetical protein SAMN02745885_01888 [Carboxydocella sporoproducens DSM 16521]
MAVVFDACAIIAWLRDEPGADMISEIIKNEDCCYLHAINAYEVYHETFYELQVKKKLQVMQLRILNL